MKKRSFFEKFTGGIRLDDDEEILDEEEDTRLSRIQEDSWVDEEPEEGQLSVDVYQTPTDIVVQTMTAGVRPEDLSITITRDMVIIKGKREENKTIDEENYYSKELYWGSFSRTVLLPEEIDPEEAEAIEKHGLVIIKLPKINKEKQTTIKIKSI